MDEAGGGGRGRQLVLGRGQVSGGTVASTAFNKVLTITDERFDPGRYNIYLFYASDGANFSHDAGPAEEALDEIRNFTNFIGYVETSAGAQLSHQSEMGKIFENLKSQKAPVGAYDLHDSDSVWNAIRAFFTDQALTTDDAA